MKFWTFVKKHKKWIIILIITIIAIIIGSIFKNIIVEFIGAIINFWILVAGKKSKDIKKHEEEIQKKDEEIQKKDEEIIIIEKEIEELKKEEVDIRDKINKVEENVSLMSLDDLLKYANNNI